MKKLLLLLITAISFAQAPTKNLYGFYAGSSTMSASAIGQFDSTNKGFLFPRMTTSQRDAIASPATSLVIFNTTTGKYNYYTGSAWSELGGDSLPSQTGNSGKYLTTNGTAASWGTVNLQSVTNGSGNNQTTNNLRVYNSSRLTIMYPNGIEVSDIGQTTSSAITSDGYTLDDGNGNGVSLGYSQIGISKDGNTGGIFPNNLTTTRYYELPNRDGELAVTTDIAENTAKIVNSNAEPDFHNAHVLFSIGNALFAGERANGSTAPKFVKYPDKNDLTTKQTITMTLGSAGVNGFETMCYDAGSGNFYGLLSNTNKIITIPAANISAYTITTISGLPSGCTFAGSGGIVTDGTYLYVGTEQSPHSFIVKLNRSTLAVVGSYEWSRPTLHSSAIDVTNGYAYFATNGANCYLLRVKLSDLSTTELALGIDNLTDDMAIGFGYIVCGAESMQDGKGAVLVELASMTAYPFQAMPSTGFFWDELNTQWINVSSEGFIETFDFYTLYDFIFSGIGEEKLLSKPHTMRGYWVNELAIYNDGGANRYFATTWENTTSGSLKEVQLLSYDNALVTRQELYNRYNSSGGGAVSSVNGSTGDVVLTQDDISDGTTYKQYSATEKTKLAAITGTNTGDETTSSIKTKLGITTLSGSNTGDQDLSGLMVKSNNLSDLTNTSTARTNLGAQAQLNGTGYIKASGTTITYDNSTYLTTSSASSTYAPIASPTFTGTVSGITKAMVGLSNVDNTSDVNKPVSTAQQTALDAKLNNSDFDATTMLAYQLLGSGIKSMCLSVPAISSMTTNSALASQALRFTAVYLQKDQTITGVKWFQATAGNYTANNYNGVGLYTYSGGTLTLVASSTNDGTIWQTTASTWGSKAFSSTYNATKGLYFIGALYCSSAQVTAPALGAGTSSANLAVNSGDFTNSAKLQGQILTQTSLPSTQASSGISGVSANVGFWLY